MESIKRQCDILASFQRAKQLGVRRGGVEDIKDMRSLHDSRSARPTFEHFAQSTSYVSCIPICPLIWRIPLHPLLPQDREVIQKRNAQPKNTEALMVPRNINSSSRAGPLFHSLKIHNFLLPFQIFFSITRSRRSSCTPCSASTPAKKRSRPPYDFYVSGCYVDMFPLVLKCIEMLHSHTKFGEQ
jgi:hypothetical protein